MANISKEILSGSTDGSPIQISATSSPGTPLHTSGTSSAIIDEVWLYAVNNDTAIRGLVVEFGGTGSSYEIIVGIPAQSGLTVVIPGVGVRGDGSTASSVAAYATVTDVINVVGFVNRLNP
jgi:hypothetical protein